MTDTTTEQRAADIYESAQCWGRWGPDDERGALNLLTPQRVAHAAGLVRSGRTVSCGRELAVTPAPDNPTPALHHMTATGDVDGFGSGTGMSGSADFLAVSFHGMAQSHIDALCHVFVGDQMWNGHHRRDVTSVGARRNAIDVAFDGICGRGVLVDIPRSLGLDFLEPDHRITPAELDRACDAGGIDPAAGDIILVNTGRDARIAAHGRWSPGRYGLAGLDPECIPWLTNADPAILGSDGVSDPLPPNSHKWAMPVHMTLLVGMGVHLLDNLALRRLSEACAQEEQWEFFLTIGPLRIRGGTGSPVNPIAVL